MPEYDVIIDRLIDKTRRGQLKWKPTAARNTFIAALEGEFTFEIMRSSDDEYFLFMSDREGNRILEVGATERQYPIRLEPTLIDRLSEIYEAARRNALEVDQKLKDAASLLDKLGTDDIPF